MANTRIKDLSNTATNVASDAFIAIDGNANGTEKISRDNLRQDTADALAAAPSTYNLAPLTSGSVDVDKGGTGSTTVAGAKTNLEIPKLGTAANEVPVNGMLNSGAWVDWDSHYEEGTWTPTLKLGGSAVSHSSQSAVFTKAGNIVAYSGVVILSNLDSLTGTVTIDGLPYTAKNTTAGQSTVTVGYAANMASLTSVPTGFVGNNESKIYFYHFGSTGAVDLSHTNLTATSQIRFSGTYQIA